MLSEADRAVLDESFQNTRMAGEAIHMVIGTVEGYPGFGEALRRLKERPQVRRVELRPLMTVAGDHAKNDLAGDEEDSWRRRLEAEGYETVCVLTGLGEHPAVRALFVEHARQAEQLQAEAC